MAMAMASELKSLGKHREAVKKKLVSTILNLSRQNWDWLDILALSRKWQPLPSIWYMDNVRSFPTLWHRLCPGWRLASPSWGEMRVRWKGGGWGQLGHLLLLLLQLGHPPASTELLLHCQLDRRQAMRGQVRCCCEYTQQAQNKSENSDLDFKWNSGSKWGWELRSGVTASSADSISWGSCGWWCYSCGLEMVGNMVPNWPVMFLENEQQYSGSLTNCKQKLLCC